MKTGVFHSVVTQVAQRERTEHRQNSATLWGRKAGQGLSHSCPRGPKEISEPWRGRASNGGRDLGEERHPVSISGYALGWEQTEPTMVPVPSHDSIGGFLFITHNSSVSSVFYQKLLNQGTNHTLSLLVVTADFSHVIALFYKDIFTNTTGNQLTYSSISLKMPQQA